MRNILSRKALSIPYEADADALAWFEDMRRFYSSAVLTPYGHAAVWDRTNGKASFEDEKVLRGLVKDRFADGGVIDA